MRTAWRSSALLVCAVIGATESPTLPAVRIIASQIAPQPANPATVPTVNVATVVSQMLDRAITLPRTSWPFRMSRSGRALPASSRP